MTEPQAPQPRPRAIAGTQPITRSDDDEGFLRHLGLPFYFRHTPPRQVARSIFWLAALAIAALVLINLILMPYQPGTIFYTLRKSLFGNGYRTFDQGYKALYSQLTVIGLILSSMVAPVVATMSFVNERSTGTLEFLRLAPLSNLSIVLGKTIPPVYPIHLAAAALYVLGVGFGVIGGYEFEHLVKIVAASILMTVTCHAAGAFCATMSILFKGVASVIVLGAIGFCLTIIPMGCWNEQCFSYLGYISPWALLEGLIWNSDYRRWGRPATSQEKLTEFFGIAFMAKHYMLLFHTAATALFLWAATRKLDSQDNTALPKTGWFVLAGLIAFTALGTMHNTPRWGGLIRGWEHAGIVLVMAGIPFTILVLIDHPHRRELVLTEECERMAGRENMPRSHWLRLRHALFALAMTGAIAGAAAFAFAQRLTASDQRTVMVMVVIIFALLAFLAATAIELAAIGFVAPWSRIAMSVLLIAALAFGVLAPFIQGVIAWDRFNRAATASIYFFQLKERVAAEAVQKKVLTEQERQQRMWEERWHNDARNDPASQIYVADMPNKEATITLRDKFRNGNMTQFYLTYHLGSFAFYLALWIGLISGLFFWRHRKYRALEDEARRAVFRNPPVLKTAAAPEAAAVAPAAESSAAT